MSEPWNLRTDDEREADTKTLFIIFCEDKVCEPTYFGHFENSKIEVNCIGKQNSMIDNVARAFIHCQENGLITKNEKGDERIDKEIKVWCVFDRDREGKEERVKIDDFKFNDSIETAERKGIKVAWSNDVFETWVLLHFEEADQTERIDVYNRLTEIFKALPKPNKDLKKVLRYHNFNYKKNLKSETNFRNIVRSLIVGKTKDAINRAKMLDESYSTNTKPSEKAPCTKVYLLVEELLHYGQKLELA